MISVGIFIGSAIWCLGVITSMICLHLAKIANSTNSHQRYKNDFYKRECEKQHKQYCDVSEQLKKTQNLYRETLFMFEDCVNKNLANVQKQIYLEIIKQIRAKEIDL